MSHIHSSLGSRGLPSNMLERGPLNSVAREEPGNLHFLHIPGSVEVTHLGTSL